MNQRNEKRRRDWEKIAHSFPSAALCWLKFGEGAERSFAFSSQSQRRQSRARTSQFLSSACLVSMWESLYFRFALETCEMCTHSARTPPREDMLLSWLTASENFILWLAEGEGNFIELPRLLVCVGAPGAKGPRLRGIVTRNNLWHKPQNYFSAQGWTDTQPSPKGHADDGPKFRIAANYCRSMLFTAPGMQMRRWEFWL